LGKSSLLWWPIGGLLIGDALLFLLYELDIMGAWPAGDWPGNERKIDWPAAIFWICAFLFVTLIGWKIGAHLASERFESARVILRHLWTIALFVGGGIFLVILPYHAIVERSLWFWAVVCLGLAVAFICSASELAFIEVCVNKSKKGYGDYDVRINELSDILDDKTVDPGQRADALKEQRKLQRLAKIGNNYTVRINPTLVVATNVANMLVAIVSTAAIYDHPNPHDVGRPCSWALSQSHGLIGPWLIQHLSPRCVSLWGQASWLPFPVNAQIFQTALALTLILMIGEILPKQLAQMYPRAFCWPRLYHIVGLIFGLGAGLSLGKFSAWATELFVSITRNVRHFFKRR
jgi:hypothetical protein